MKFFCTICLSDIVFFMLLSHLFFACEPTVCSKSLKICLNKSKVCCADPVNISDKPREYAELSVES